MSEHMLVQHLVEQVGAISRLANYCVHDQLPNLNPGLEVADVGRVRLPLGPTQFKKLAAKCHPAHYGKGTKTLLDKRVRNTLELDPAELTITNPAWNETIATTVRSVAVQLGLPEERLEPHLYKLLLYGPNGFFLPHRDSEKEHGMVASLIVMLPSQFRGGELKVKHLQSRTTIRFELASRGLTPEYAAFYADCEHEVAPVQMGHRLCLAYNLVLRPERRAKKPAAANPDRSQAHELAVSLASWAAKNTETPLVFALDHHYTQHGLSLDLLKGNDRQLAELVLAAAKEAGCDSYLCQVERHLTQDVLDFSDRRRYGRTKLPAGVELGGVINDSLQGKEWVAADGTRQQFPNMLLSTSSIVSTTPLDSWVPTEEEYEGYTGNAGNTLDRWYRRSAICVWTPDQYYYLLARNGGDRAIRLVDSKIKALRKTSQSQQAAARSDCLALMRAIIKNWSWNFDYALEDQEKASVLFLKSVEEIDDPNLARELFACVPEQDPGLDISRLVVKVCQRYGCTPFARELTALLSAGRQELRPRDLKWMERLASKAMPDDAATALVGRLVDTAIAQFCQESKQPFYHDDNDSKRLCGTLLPLLRICLILGNNKGLENLIRFVVSKSPRFSVEKVQLECLEKLLQWHEKKELAVRAAILAWLTTIRQGLAASTATRPEPPADWARPATLNCNCRFCKQLQSYLEDPQAETARFSLAESARTHLTYKIEQARCDASYKLDKSKRPYSLMLTKTQASYERQRSQFETDQQLLVKVDQLLTKAARPAVAP